MRPGNDLLERAAARHELVVREARRSFAAFVSHVFGWTLAPFHLRWLDEIEHHDRVVVLAPMEHGKTSILLAYVLWRLGHDPNLRIALLHATHSQAVRPMAAIREHVQTNARLREVFPGLKPATGARAKWADDEIVVERSVTSKDPSVLAIGVFGPLLGARVDLVVADDLTTFENSLTMAARQKLIAWWRSTLVGRVVAAGKIVAVGTPWAENDLLAVLAASGEYRVVRDPALNDLREPLWPEVWPVERLEQRRREVGEIEFSRTMLLRVLSDAASRFKAEWFDFSIRAAADAGVTLCQSYDGPCPTFTGVDLGVGTTTRHDESALVTIAALPDDRRQLLNIEAGRWQAPELVARIKDVQQRFKSRVRVESNAAQAYIGQFLAAQGVTVEAHTTTKAKFLGIEALAVEIEQGRWLLPDAPATRVLVREMLAYSPADHPGDRLVGLWLAREATVASTRRDPWPMPFITDRTAPLFPASPPSYPRSTGAVVSTPSGFPEDAWLDAPFWTR